MFGCVSSEAHQHTGLMQLQFRGPDWPNKPYQAPSLERTAPIHGGLSRKSWAHPLLLRRGACLVSFIFIWLSAVLTFCGLQAQSYIGSLIGAIVQVNFLSPKADDLDLTTVT